MKRKHYAKLAASLLAISLVVGACPVTESPFIRRVKAAEASELENGSETGGQVYEDNSALTVTATENMTDYPWKQWDVGSAQTVTLPVGTVLEYDMEVESAKTFDSLYWETKIGWESPDDYSWCKHLKASDFTDSKRHEKITLDKEYKLNDSEAQKWGVQVQTGDASTDYVGVVTCSALKLTLPGQTDDPSDPTKPTEPENPETPGEIVSGGTQVISVTDDTVGAWPYVQFDISNAGTIYAGTTVEYDVAVENTDFTGIYWETDFNWTRIHSKTLVPGDFSNHQTHVKVTFVGEPVDKLSGVQVKTGRNDTDYRGTITVSNLKVTPAKPESPDGGDESDFEETVLFSGSEEIGGEKLKEIHTSGNFNMKKVMEGGYFYVEYKADEKAVVKLALSDWDNAADRWQEMLSTDSGVGAETGTYFAKFSYLACANALGSTNFSVVDAITVKVPDATVTITSIKWRGPKLADSGSTGGSSYGSSSSGNAGTNEASGSKDDKDDSAVISAPAVEKNQNQTVSGQNYIVTKGGENGEAEVAFVEAPEGATKVVIPDTITVDGVTCKVTYIAAEAFKGDTKITSVKIGSNVKKIGAEAFASCASLKNVTISSSVTTIGEKAFYGCKKLKKITITSIVLKSVESKAFSGINKNAVIDVPDGSLKTYKKLFTAKTGFKKTMKLI